MVEEVGSLRVGEGNVCCLLVGVGGAECGCYGEGAALGDGERSGEVPRS
jgi:hypothetical protein